MQCCRAAAATLLVATSLSLTQLYAQQFSSSGGRRAPGLVITTTDGWHAPGEAEAGAKSGQLNPTVRPDGEAAELGSLATPEPLPVALQNDALSRFIAAQSPEDELRTISGPVWTYPSRRTVTTVPVPEYQGRIDYERPAAERLARRPGTLSGRYLDSDTGNSIARASSPQGTPPLPTFHGSPFAEPAAAGPANYQTPRHFDPFEDPCALVGDGGWSYTANSGYFFGLFDAFRLEGESTRLAARLGLNWGLPTIDDASGLGFQIGFSGSAAEEGPQWFVTTGLFYRGDARIGPAWNVGAVFDWMNDSEYNSNVGQVRGKTSISLDTKNELGLWGAASVIDDKNSNGDTAEPVDQINLFYRYLFYSGWDATGWVGWRREPESVAVGGELFMPLNDYWAGTVGGHYAFEGDTWNVFAGFVRHWSNRARQDYLGQHRHLPYLPVADNSTMTLFLDR